MENLGDLVVESNAHQGSSDPSLLGIWKPILRRLYYLFPPDYHFYRNDAEQLWCLFGGSPLDLLDVGFFHFSHNDHSTGMPMYKLDDHYVAEEYFRITDDDVVDDHYVAEEYFRIIDDDVGSCVPNTTKHVSVRGSIVDSSFLKSLYEIKALQTLLILRGNGNGPRINSLPHDFFHKLPSLQALDLSHTDITELPIGGWPRLRYLNLSYTSIVELPNSLCNVLTLETLNLRGCSKLIGLPKAIRRLTSLMHLDVDVSCLLLSMPPGVGDLHLLQTLPAFVVGKQHGVDINELENLKNLRQNLSILRLENVSSPTQAKEASLYNKHLLQNVEFHWSRPVDGLDVLISLRPSQYIEKLQIVGYGGAEFPSWIGDPIFESLTTITIHNCTRSAVLPNLGSLPSLMFLHISDMNEVKVVDQHFGGKHIMDRKDYAKAFPMLEHLTFNGMPELNHWIGVREGDFPHLKNLKISDCPKLNILPKLSLFKSLQQLEVSLCHSLESFLDGEILQSLQSVVIIECPMLKERCHKDIIDNWEKYVHIPNIWIDYQQISQVEETPEARNLITSENATENMIIIPSNSDICLPTISSLLGDGGGGRRQIEEQFEEAEKIVLRRYEYSSTKAAEYRSSVDVILQLAEELTLSYPDEVDIKDRVDTVLSMAMSRLGDEFRHILIRNTVPPDAGRFHELITSDYLSFASTSSAPDSFAPTDEDIDDFESSADDDNCRFNLIYPDAVMELKEIAERMIRCNAEECFQVYSSVRRDVLDECLSNLGIDKPSTKVAQRSGWSNLDEKIKNWIHALKIVVWVLLSVEKDLCDEIFQGSELIKEICFTETAKGCVIHLLKYGESIAFAIGKHSMINLFPVLDMYEALAAALPKLQELFSVDSGDFLHSEGSVVLEVLLEAAKGAFTEFENAVQNETSWMRAWDGVIHPLTHYVTSYVRLLGDYSDLLNFLLESSTDISDHVENDDDISHLGIDSSLGRRLLLLLSSLESNLGEKSKLYEDVAFQYIFLMNNIHYIVQKVKDSYLRKILGDRWVRKRRGQVHQFATGYMRATWSKALSCLTEEGLGDSGSSSNASKTILKERFKSFNLCFEEVYKTQTQWRMPDHRLRDELRISISMIVLPAYRSFLGRFGSHLASGRHAGKYIKYTPDDLENSLFELFGGSSELLHIPKTPVKA